MELSPEEWEPTPPQTGNTSFTFLAVEPQNERPRMSAGVRKQMKSHLTLLQHKRTRQERAQKISGWLKSTLGRREEANVGTEAEGCVKVTRAGKSLAVQNDVDAESAEMITTRLSQSAERMLWKLPTGTLEQSFSRGTMAFRTFALNDPANVVGASLSRLQLDVSSVLRFYHAIVDFQSKDFADQWEFEHAAAFDIFMDIVLRDPIPLTTAILITTRHMLLMRGTAPSPRDTYQQEVMRGYLISCLNTALDDPRRSISNPLLTAVALLAIYEVKYGNLREYHIHMAGLVQMVKLRGGIAEIDRQTQFIGHFLIWTDTNSSAIAECQPYFDESVQETCCKADPHMFTLTEVHQRSDIRVENKATPG